MNKDGYQTHIAQSITQFVSLARTSFINLRLLTAVIAISLSCPSAYAVWKDSSGNPLPDTESKRSVGDFGGSLLITSDSDWQAKWDTPSGTTPNFKEVKAVHRGEPVFMLTFFANPKLNAKNEANITCDFRITKPDGTEAMSQRDAICFQGQVNGPPYSIYRAVPVINFVSEKSDPLGVWTIEITLKDNVRNVVVPLKATLTLE